MSGFIRARSHSEAQHEQAGDHEAAASPLRISHLQVQISVSAGSAQQMLREVDEQGIWRKSWREQAC